MKLYWDWTSIPELSKFSEKEKRQIWKKHCKNIKVILYFVIAGLFAGLVVYISYLLELKTFLRLLSVMIGGGIGSFISMQFAIRSLRQSLGRSSDLSG